MGRPTKLTDDLRDELARHLAAGNPIKTACALVGIGESTYHKWRARGKAERERVAEGHANCRVRKAERPFVEFMESTTRARAEASRKRVANITEAADEDWRAAAWLLERREPETWGQKKRVEHAGKGGGPIQTAQVSIEEWREQQKGRIEGARQLMERFEATDVDELEAVEEEQTPASGGPSAGEQSA
jgi:hypothetical protein